MKIMVIGNGGREHAIIRSLKKNPKVSEIFALSGNGGIAADAVCLNIAPKDIDGIVKFATEQKIDYAVVAPDDPLVLGAVDKLSERGIRCFGPDSKAAIIEGSKGFAKDLMRRYGIPTAKYEIFTDKDKATEYIRKGRFPVVIKADGLALGKGVVIAENFAQAEKALNDIMTEKVFGNSGDKVVVEEFLQGPEVSVLCFTDGKTIVPMTSSMDHKRASDGDKGLNTGGMGTVAPNPYYTEEIAARCMREIFLPTINAMNNEGRTFKGCLYFGLMLTLEGPKVIEYNCRFGDPETQVVLPLLKSDLLDVMTACTDGTLADMKVEFYDKHACCVIMASEGYPSAYEKGYEITMPKDELIFVAGAKEKDGKLVTSGGRVLGVTAVAESLEDAVSAAYDKVKKISFENAYYRKDIGKRAMQAKEK